MGNMDVPSQRGPIKCPMGTYEFGANVISEKVRAKLAAISYIGNAAP